MPVDPPDNSRDEILRAERRRDERRLEKEQAAKKAGQDFQSKYHTQLKARESAESKKEGNKGDKEEEGLFSQIVAAYRRKEDGKEHHRKEDNRKEEREKDKFREEFGGKSRLSSGEEHRRVESSQSSGDRQGSGGFEGGGGGFSGGQGGGSSGGKRDSSSGFKGSGQKEGQPIPVRPVAPNSFSGQSGADSQSGRFSRKTLDEVVEAVSLRQNEEGNPEMEIQLSDSTFSGLRFKAAKTSHGIVLTFICPNRVVKNIFLMNRPKIYEALQQKQIRLCRIDVV